MGLEIPDEKCRKEGQRMWTWDLATKNLESQACVNMEREKGKSFNFS